MDTERGGKSIPKYSMATSKGGLISIMARLRITLEFNKSKMEDLKLYQDLQKYSNPGAYIKDALRGLVPLPGHNFKQEGDIGNR